MSIDMPYYRRSVEECLNQTENRKYLTAIWLEMHRAKLTLPPSDELFKLRDMLSSAMPAGAVSINLTLVVMGIHDILDLLIQLALTKERM